MKRTYINVTRKYMVTASVTAALMLVCSATALVFDKYIASVLGVVFAVAAISYITVVARTRKKNIVKFLHNITGDDMDLSENLITSVPMPMAVCSIDGVIRWYNDMFETIFKERKLAEESFEDCITSLKWSDVLKFPNGRKTMEIIDDNIYSVNWRIMKDKIRPNESGDHYSVFFYLKDITRECNTIRKYENERVDIATVNIDNFDEFMQKVDDEAAETAASRVRAAVINWAKSVNAVFKRLERDKYFVAFEHRNLEKCIQDNFSIIDNVMKIAEEIKFPISISIGIGTGGSITENEVSARHALDLALGRGGGQVCIKSDNEFKFYGGKNVEYERSTRVKARSVATALTDLIKNSDNVILVGHKGADFDCFGAAVGLARAVRTLGKTPFVVHERVAPAVECMFDELKNVEEYDGMFVDEYEAVEKVTADTLLIVLDTHRPSMLPSQKLLEKVGKVVIIDHHRRSTEFISSCALVYHEPYASSACEMVTELLEYMNTGNSITKIEAQCLYTGIIMDTKNFMLKTGVRTFEAASYLRRLGLDTVAVRRMFSSELDDFTKKAEIVSESELMNGEFAISKTYETHPNIRMIASQAADEMLSLRRVTASVVVFPIDGGVGFSARSIGTVNVQLIMESIGGGGHMTVAGATIMGIDVTQGIETVKNAIKQYLNERKK